MLLQFLTLQRQHYRNLKVAWISPSLLSYMSSHKRQPSVQFHSWKLRICQCFFKCINWKNIRTNQQYGTTVGTINFSNSTSWVRLENQLIFKPDSLLALELMNSWNAISQLDALNWDKFSGVIGIVFEIFRFYCHSNGLLVPPYLLSLSPVVESRK